MPSPGRLYFGHVAHRRMAPIEHEFRYRIFSMVIDVDRVDELARPLKLFSAERFNLFSFFRKDHGTRDGSPLRPWIESELRRHDISTAPARIELLCFPRILGHVFNPLSVYYCVNADERLFAIVYEVKNTFGGQHTYVARLASAVGPDEEVPAHGTAKAFYVSPFIQMQAHYTFHARLPGDRLQLTIDEADEAGEPVLWAGWFGREAAFSDQSLLRAFFRYPLMTLKVVMAIHWQAVRVLLKGAKYRSQPAERGKESTAAEILPPSQRD